MYAGKKKKKSLKRKNNTAMAGNSKKALPLHRFFDVTYGRKTSSLAMLRETIQIIINQDQWI